MEIKKSVLYVNGKKAFVPENQNLRYIVSNIILPSDNTMVERYGLEKGRGDYYTEDGGESFKMNLTKDQLDELKSKFPQAKFEIDLEPQYVDVNGYEPTAFDLVNNLNMFPKDLYVNNTTTDYMKFQIPKKAKRSPLTKTISLGTEGLSQLTKDTNWKSERMEFISMEKRLVLTLSV